MPTLSQSLINHDLGHLSIIAEHWGIELDAPNASQALPSLVVGILKKEPILEMLEILPEKAANALQALTNSNGRIKWATFSRQHGGVLDIGAGRRDRERPDRDPISPVEFLWYRAFIARAFFETDAGAVEFVYIPSDLYDLLPGGDNAVDESRSTNLPAGILDTPAGFDFVPGRMAARSERLNPVAADDHLVDDACTLLAGLRCGRHPTIHLNERLLSKDQAGERFLFSLLKKSAVINDNDLPDTELSREFLELSRGSCLLRLSNTWLNSIEHNDLKMVPELVVEGEWKNDPLSTRMALIQLLSIIPENQWWSLSAFIADIHNNCPDFQRPEGDYDSWFLKNKDTGDYLRGFDNWYKVDGKLIEYIITGPLHWLGITDLATSKSAVTAFRLTRPASHLLEGKLPDNINLREAKIHVDSKGMITVPKSSSPVMRYQIARFCEWKKRKRDNYIYRLTSKSLNLARRQGLRIGHILTILRRSAESVPPNLVSGLSRWDERGAEVKIQAATILRTSSKKMLQTLRSSRASRYLEDPIGPTTVIVKPGAIDKVLAILIEMGYFGSVESN